MKKSRKWILVVSILSLVVGWSVGCKEDVDRSKSAPESTVVLDKRILDKRTVYLKIVVEESFEPHCGWVQFFGNMTGEASKQFDKQLGIKFEIKKIEKINNLPNPLYNIDTTVMIGGVIYRTNDADWMMNHIDPENCDIVICFSSEFRTYSGCSKVLGRYAFITYYGNFKKTLRVFIHEVGHLFGAMHIEDVNSVMYWKSVYPWPLEFDDINKELIFKYKWRNFNERI